MIVSHRHRFVFIKTHKTAGTSVEISLSRFAGAEDVITPVAAADEAARKDLGLAPQNHQGAFNPLPDLWAVTPFSRKRRVLKRWREKRRFYNHMSALEARNRLGHRVWSDYFTFCFERNPFDKVVSDYFWVLGAKRGAAERSFDDHVRRGRLPRDWGKYTVGGELAVDFVGRFERLGEDLQRICEHVGIDDFDGWLPRLKGAWRDPASKPYQNFIGPEARRRIEELYRHELDHFGYRFEEADRALPARMP